MSFIRQQYQQCVGDLEHARAEICDMKSMSCTKCSLLLVEDACNSSCDN
jgi:hypothetical protein